MVKILKTRGENIDFMKEKPDEVCELFVTSLEAPMNSDMHDVGDLLMNSEGKLAFAFLAKTTLNSKIDKEALRTSVTFFIRYFKEHFKDIPKTFLINRYQFNSSRELKVFELMITTACGLLLSEEEMNSFMLVITGFDDSEAPMINII